MLIGLQWSRGRAPPSPRGLLHKSRLMGDPRMIISDSGPPLARWLASAREARALAETMTEDGARSILFRIAAAYESFASVAINRGSEGSIGLAQTRIARSPLEPAIGPALNAPSRPSEPLPLGRNAAFKRRAHQGARRPGDETQSIASIGSFGEAHPTRKLDADE